MFSFYPHVDSVQCWAHLWSIVVIAQVRPIKGLFVSSHKALQLESDGGFYPVFVFSNKKALYMYSTQTSLEPKLLETVNIVCFSSGFVFALVDYANFTPPPLPHTLIQTV